MNCVCPEWIQRFRRFLLPETIAGHPVAHRIGTRERSPDFFSWLRRYSLRLPLAGFHYVAYTIDNICLRSRVGPGPPCRRTG